MHGDDLSVVRHDWDGSVIAHGIPKPVMADADLLSAAGLPAVPVNDDPRGRSALPTSLLGTGWVPLRALVVVGHSGDAASTRMLTHAGRLTALFSSSFEASRPSARRRDFRRLAALSRLPGFRLEHAAVRDQRLERAAAMLEQISSYLDGRIAVIAP